MPGSRIVIKTDDITPRLAAAPQRLDAALGAVARYEAARVQNAMRSRAPWTDRTGNARNGLFAKAGREGDHHVIELMHSVPYGIWLETRWSGRYAIIAPTVASESPAVARAAAEVLRRL